MFPAETLAALVFEASGEHGEQICTISNAREKIVFKKYFSLLYIRVMVFPMFPSPPQPANRCGSSAHFFPAGNTGN